MAVRADIGGVLVLLVILKLIRGRKAASAPRAAVAPQVIIQVPAKKRRRKTKR